MTGAPTSGDIPEWLGRFLQIVPITTWVAAGRNTLRQLGLVFTLLFVLFLLAYLIPDGFAPDQRLLILGGIGLLGLIALLIVAAVTLIPGDRLYAPYERMLDRGAMYGTEQQPRRRRAVLGEPRTTPPDVLTRGIEQPGLPFPQDQP